MPLEHCISYGTLSFRIATFSQVLTSREEKKEGKSASQGGDQDPDKVSLTC